MVTDKKALGHTTLQQESRSSREALQPQTNAVLMLCDVAAMLAQAKPKVKVWCVVYGAEGLRRGKAGKGLGSPSKVMMVPSTLIILAALLHMLKQLSRLY